MARPRTPKPPEPTEPVRVRMLTHVVNVDRGKDLEPGLEYDLDPAYATRLVASEQAELVPVAKEELQNGDKKKNGEDGEGGADSQGDGTSTQRGDERGTDETRETRGS